MLITINRAIALILAALILYAVLLYLSIIIITIFLYVWFEVLSRPKIVVAYLEEMLEVLPLLIAIGVTFWQNERICSLLRTDSWFGASSRAKKMADESAEKEMTSKSE